MGADREAPSSVLLMTTTHIIVLVVAVPLVLWAMRADRRRWATRPSVTILPRCSLPIRGLLEPALKELKRRGEDTLHLPSASHAALACGHSQGAGGGANHAGRSVSRASRPACGLSSRGGYRREPREAGASVRKIWGRRKAGLRIAFERTQDASGTNDGHKKKRRSGFRGHAVDHQRRRARLSRSDTARSLARALHAAR